MREFKLQRIGMVMEPEPGNPHEVEGVLNRGAARGPDGQLYLFPRSRRKGELLAHRHRPRTFNDAGDPAGVERLGIALEPEADYDGAPMAAACEDARVTFVEPLKRLHHDLHAYSPNGPRIALAQSEDLIHWQRMGWRPLLCGAASSWAMRTTKMPASFGRDSQPVGASGVGHAAPAALSGTPAGGNRLRHVAPHSGSRSREHLDFLFCPTLEGQNPDRLGRFTSHHRLATPVSPWERLKIGAGTPPVLTRHGWLSSITE